LKSLAFDAMENESAAGAMPGMPGMANMPKTPGSEPGSATSEKSAMTTSRLASGAAFNVLKLSVGAGEQLAAKLPLALSSINPIRTQGAAERKIDLSLQGTRFLINGKSYQLDEIAFEVKRGAVEVWRINNPALGMPHPMHIHGFSFQVVERIGSPPQVSRLARFGNGLTVSDLGWKDTVLVWPGETVRIAIDFAHDFPGSQTYVFHCHNLEHEDGGMMVNYRVV
jgi:blue copper oxidase